MISIVSPRDFTKEYLLCQEGEGTLPPGHFMHRYLKKWKVTMEIDCTGISLFISLIKYKGHFEGVQKAARHAELEQVPAFTLEESLESLLKQMRNRSRLLLASSISSSLICKAFQGWTPSPIQSTQSCQAVKCGWGVFSQCNLTSSLCQPLKQHQPPRGFRDTSPWSKSCVRLRQRGSDEGNTARSFGGWSSRWRG